jgi:TPR repeat protein
MRKSVHFVKQRELEKQLKSMLRKYGSGWWGKCPFCNADRCITDEEMADQIMKRVTANDAASIYLLANSYDNGTNGFQQDHAKAIKLYARAADLGHSKTHSQLASIYCEGGNLKKAKFHYEAAAMLGHEVARFNIGVMDYNSGNMEQAIKHLTISASAGCYDAMNELRLSFEQGLVSRESIDSTLTAYNYSCAEMRSEARDASIRALAETI